MSTYMNINQIKADLESESRLLEEAYVKHLHEHAQDESDRDWAAYCDNLVKQLNSSEYDY